MCAITLNEFKAVLKVSPKAGQNGVVDKISMEPMAQDDDFEEVKRCKRHISINTSQTVKMPIRPVPISAAVKLSPKAVLTCNFSALLRTMNMDTETTE
jgi:hypothetical protein